MPKPTATLQVDVISTAAMLATGTPLVEPGLHEDVAQYLINLALRTREGQPLAITIRSRQHAPDDLPAVEAAMRTHFARQVDAHTLRIGEILRQARIATVGGLIVVAILLAIAAKIPAEEGRPLLTAIRESLTIFAWVTMWRPAELWLFEHLPERRLRRVTRRLHDAPISLVASA